MDIEDQNRVAAAFKRLESFPDGVGWLVGKTASFCVGLFWMGPTLHAVGSGVLVRYRGHGFAATCSHVIRRPSADPSLVLYYGQANLMEVSPDDLIRATSLADDELEETTTDVGAVLLTTAGVERLESAGKNFLELPQGPLQMPDARQPFVIVGYPEERIQEGLTRDGEILVVDHVFAEELVQARKVGLSANDLRYKFEKFGSIWPEEYNGPRSLHGMSGGGVWQVELEEDDNHWTLGEPQLVGLYQSQGGTLKPYLMVEKIETWKREMDGLLDRGEPPE